MRDALLWAIAALLLLTLLSLWFVLYQIVRQQGRLLLRIEQLEDGAGFEAVEEAEREPIGVPQGEPLSAFRLPDLAGRQIALEDFAGRGVLLINWSSDCGYCDLIAPDLARLVADLRKRKTELVLATHGTARLIRSFTEEHGLEGTVLLQNGSELEAFESLGTPVAYLLDEEGRVAKPLASVPTRCSSSPGMPPAGGNGLVPNAR